MPTEILMPALSPTMEEGKLAKWLVKEGQQVKAGDIIAEIETDKATMEVEAVDEGKVGRLLIAEGTEGVKVNTPIAVLLADGESAGAATLPRQRLSRRRRLLQLQLRQPAPPRNQQRPRRRRKARRLPTGTVAPVSWPRRWRGGSPKTQASIWRRWRAQVRTGASSSAMWRPRSRAAGCACSRRPARRWRPSPRRR